MSTFGPDAEVVQRAKRHILQLDRLIIVDDGSTDSQALDELSGSGFVIIKLATNSGIAFALNTGMKIALKDGADYILNIDQDSILDEGYISKVLKTFDEAAHATRLGIVVTDAVNHVPSIPPKYSPEGFGLVEEAIQSGLVVSAGCLKSIGFLDEKLFIDCVDIEFCLRARDSGWNIAVGPGTNITHSLGRQEPYRPFGRQRVHNGQTVTYQYHPPFRRYYIMRNNIDLCLRNIRRRPRWVASVLRREFQPLVRTLTSGPETAAQWAATLVGALHGLVRQRGRIPTWLEKQIAKP